MKKLLLFIVATMFVGSISAQDSLKNIFGIRAGVNLSNFNFNDDEADTDIRTSINAGVSYERILSKKLPLYIETGLMYSNKGYQYTEIDEYDDETYDYKTSLSYFEIPLKLNYKFNVSNAITLYPSAGLYYSFGVGGNTKEIYEEQEDGEIYQEIYKSKVFGDDGYLNRSYFGYRVSVSIAYNKFVLSAGYEGSILNIAKKFDDSVSPKIRNSNIFVSLGYNF